MLYMCVLFVIVSIVRVETQDENQSSSENDFYTSVVILDIVYKDNSKRICSGSIIHDNVVLSTAHCFVKQKADEVIKADLTTSFVVIGSKEMYASGYEQYLPIERVLTHPNYNLGWNADIALVFTFAGMTGDKPGKVLPLINGELDQRNATIYIASWGAISTMPKMLAESRSSSEQLFRRKQSTTPKDTNMNLQGPKKKKKSRSKSYRSKASEGVSTFDFSTTDTVSIDDAASDKNQKKKSEPTHYRVQEQSEGSTPNNAKVTTNPKSFRTEDQPQVSTFNDAHSVTINKTRSEPKSNRSKEDGVDFRLSLWEPVTMQNEPILKDLVSEEEKKHYKNVEENLKKKFKTSTRNIPTDWSTASKKILNFYLAPAEYAQEMLTNDFEHYKGKKLESPNDTQHFRAQRRNNVAAYGKNPRRRKGDDVNQLDYIKFYFLPMGTCKEYIDISLASVFQIKSEREALCFASAKHYITDSDSGAPVLLHGSLVAIVLGGVQQGDERAAVGLKISCFCSWILDHLPRDGVKKKCCDQCCLIDPLKTTSESEKK